MKRTKVKEAVVDFGSAKALAKALEIRKRQTAFNRQRGGNVRGKTLVFLVVCATAKIRQETAHIMAPASHSNSDAPQTGGSGRRLGGHHAIPIAGEVNSSQCLDVDMRVCGVLRTALSRPTE